MMKKIIAILIVTCATMGLVACGGKEISQVTMNGKKYNLSGDFQDVVGEMTKNGITVIDSLSMIVYDDDGKYGRKVTTQMIRDGLEDVCFANETLNVNPASDSKIVVASYQLRSAVISNFKTMDGITEESDADDIAKLEGYVPQRGILKVDGQTYAAVYIDGEKVDLEEYENEAEDWIDCASEKGAAFAMDKYFPDLRECIPANCKLLNSIYYVNQFQTNDFSDEKLFLQEELSIAFAAREAGEMLYDEEIDSFDIVVYEHTGEEIWVYYYHYYYDENWDVKKFYPKR